MDLQKFRDRIKSYKQAKGQNPQLNYWEWKRYAEGTEGVTDYKQQIQKDVEMQNQLYDINHTDPNTGEKNPFYNRFTDDYGTVELPEVSVTAPITWKGVNAQKAKRGRQAYHKGAETAFKVAAPLVAGAGLASMAGAGLLSTAINPVDAAFIATDPTQPLNYLPFVGQGAKYLGESANYINKTHTYVKIPNIRLGRWSAKFPEYGNQNKAFRQVDIDAVDDYINTGIVGPESETHNAMRSAQNANKNFGGGSNHIATLLTKHFGNHVMFNKTKPFYGKDSKYSRVLIGDLENPRINWKKVNHKGHKSIVDPVDPSTGEFTIPISEFDVWRKSKIGWLRDQKANRFAEGGEVKEWNPNITGEGYDDKGYYAQAMNQLPEIQVYGNKNIDKSEISRTHTDVPYYNYRFDNINIQPGRGALEIVSPEFDLISGVRGMVNIAIPKLKFNNAYNLTEANKNTYLQKALNYGDIKTVKKLPYYKRYGVTKDIAEKNINQLKDIGIDIDKSPFFRENNLFKQNRLIHTDSNVTGKNNIKKTHISNNGLIPGKLSKNTEGIEKIWWYHNNFNPNEVYGSKLNTRYIDINADNINNLSSSNFNKRAILSDNISFDNLNDANIYETNPYTGFLNRVLYKK